MSNGDALHQVNDINNLGCIRHGGWRYGRMLRCIQAGLLRMRDRLAGLDAPDQRRLMAMDAPGCRTMLHPVESYGGALDGRRGIISQSKIISCIMKCSRIGGHSHNVYLTLSI